MKTVVFNIVSSSMICIYFWTFLISSTQVQSQASGGLRQLPIMKPLSPSYNTKQQKQVEDGVKDVDTLGLEVSEDFEDDVGPSTFSHHKQDESIESAVKEAIVLTAPKDEDSKLIEIMEDNEATEVIEEIILPDAEEVVEDSQESNIKMTQKEEHAEDDHLNYPGKGGVVIMSLGGGEDEVTMLLLADLLNTNGHKVTLVLYGSGTREGPVSSGIKVLEIPEGLDDPLYAKDDEGITPEDGGDDWAGGKIVASRVAACKQVSQLPWVEETVKGADLLVAPLFLHDLCVLGLAERSGVPAVGVLTSRLGAWWVWHNLGITPLLATTSVPPHSMKENGIWERASNLARHYGYLSGLRQHWQAAAVTSVLRSWSSMPPLHEMYNGLRKVLIVWDPLTDSHSPTSPHVVNVGGFFTVTGHMTKDVLVPALLNRAGVITVSAGGREVWIGHAALENLYIALAHTEFTVLWKNAHDHLSPNVTLQEDPRAKFVYRETLPLNDILSHPRHRLMISTCGESDVMAAVHFASPILCLPVTPDQHMAAREVVKLGIGEMVPAQEASIANVKKAFTKLMGKEKADIRRRSREVAEEVHDQPMATADRLLYHIEYIIRHPNSRRSLRQDHGLYLLQQSNADVYLLLLLLLVSLIALLIAIAIQLVPVLLKKSKKKRD